MRKKNCLKRRSFIKKTAALCSLAAYPLSIASLLSQFEEKEKSVVIIEGLRGKGSELFEILFQQHFKQKGFKPLHNFFHTKNHFHKADQPYVDVLLNNNVWYQKESSSLQSNSYWHDYVENNGTIQRVRRSGHSKIKNYSAEKKRRFNMLKASRGKYLLRAKTPDLTPEILQHLRQNFQLIFLHQKDQQRHILEFALTSMRKIYTVRGQDLIFKEQPSSIHLSIQDFNEIQRIEKSFWALRNQFQDSPLVYTEDFHGQRSIENIDFLATASSPSKVNYASLKFELEDLTEYFSNKEDVRKWLKSIS